MDIKIAVVQATCGHLTCVGPNDFNVKNYPDQMSAAIGWHIEAGYMPAATYWVAADIPTLPEIATLAGTVA